MDTKKISLESHIQKTLSDYLPDDLIELATENIMLHDKLTQPQQTVNNFCETHEEKCTMSYCDDNGCMNRKRSLVDVNDMIPQNTVSDEEIVKGFLDSLDKDILSDRALLKMFYNWMRHKLQPQTNEGELIEFVNSRLKSLEEQSESPEILDKYRIEVKIEAYKEILSQFKALQNTNKET